MSSPPPVAFVTGASRGIGQVLAGCLARSGYAVAAAARRGSRVPRAGGGSAGSAFAAGGALLGALLALVLDRRSVKRQERAVVEAVPDSEPDTDPQG